MGEVRGRAPDGFDFGNSPFEVSGVDFGGKTIIQRTSAGTQGIVAASHAKRLYATSLVTAEANRSRPSLGITRSGHTRPQGGTMASIDEDELCAIHLGSRLESRPGDADPPAA